MPLTLTPDKTWRSLLALIPVVAIFLAVAVVKPNQQRLLIMGLFGFTTLSVLLAIAQVAAGGTGFYLWPTTDAGNVVGFFANRNHFATLCLLTIPFLAVTAGRELRRRTSGSALVLWLSLLGLGVIVLMLGVIRSRAGVVLLPPTLAASLLAAWFASGGRRPKTWLLGLIGATVAAVVAGAALVVEPVLERFDSAGAKEGRFENWPLVAEAANTYLPLGSGLGSFDAVFRSVEPLDTLDPTFFNQAHNDYLELWLETGWLGGGLLLVFFVWFARRSWAAWRAPVSSSSDLQRAASVAIVVVLAHSAVDYPLRTLTIAVTFALCCAFLDLAGSSASQQQNSPSRRRDS